jgi:hypothetical protein
MHGEDPGLLIVWQFHSVLTHYFVYLLFFCTHFEFLGTVLFQTTEKNYLCYFGLEDKKIITYCPKIDAIGFLVLYALYKLFNNSRGFRGGASFLPV